MIHLVQPGQYGTTSMLFDMHRLRKRIFVDYLKWDVKANKDNLETDEFDRPDTVYLLATDDDGRVIGNIRLLPFTGPTMISEIWPKHALDLDIPLNSSCWELSRFTVSSLKENHLEAKHEQRKAIAELFVTLTEICIAAGIQQVLALHDERIARVVASIGCKAFQETDWFSVDAFRCRIGAFRTDVAMLENIRRMTGCVTSYAPFVLPPAMTRLPHLIKRPSYA